MKVKICHSEEEINLFLKKIKDRKIININVSA
jgi:hypothetical protein